MPNRNRMTLAAVAAGAALVLGATGTAAAEPTVEEPQPKTEAQKFFERLGPPPADCHIHWDPVEKFLEDRINDATPTQLVEAFEAFDDWCEGDND